MPWGDVRERSGQRCKAPLIGLRNPTRWASSPTRWARSRPGGPGARPGGPGARPGGPGARPGGPAARPGGPGALPGGPAARPGRPGADQVGQEPDQVGQQPDQVGQEPDQVGQQPDQVGQEPTRWARSPTRWASSRPGGPGVTCSEAAAQREKEGAARVRACGVWGAMLAIRLVPRSVPGDVLTAQPARQVMASRRSDCFSCRVVAVAQALAGCAWRAAWPGMPLARR
ncbi:Uncharacterised protein [Comamonas aquatica]|nr:Uncharacterised protein [Comamonas aquatica]CAC9218238.1 Uncharacterised protein [Comamonas aquatica]